MSTASVFYRKCLSEELQESVSKQLALLMPEQLSLTEEVAISKNRVADAVKEWSIARSIYDKVSRAEGASIEDIDRCKSRVTATSARMAECLRDHKDLSLTAATVETKTREVMNERTLMLFMNACIELVEEMYGHEKLDEFQDKLRSRVVIQEADNNSLAIEGEIYAMMQTIEGPNASH